MKSQSRRYQNGQPDAPHPPDSLWFCPFAPNERSQIRTYVARDTYRQGVLSTSI